MALTMTMTMTMIMSQTRTTRMSSRYAFVCKMLAFARATTVDPCHTPQNFSNMQT